MSNAASSATVSGTTWSNNATGGTVKFSTDSTTTTSTSKNIYVGGKISIVAEENTGWEFKGWYNDPTLNSSSQVAGESNWGTAHSTDAECDTASMPGSAVTYYARFDIRKYAVTLHAQYNTADATATYTDGTTGGTVGGAASYCYNKQANLTASPASGYEFTGWYTKSGTTYTQVSTATPYTPTITAEAEYYARFSIKKYSVTVYAQGNAANADNAANATDTWTRDTGGTASAASTSIYYGKTTTLTAKPSTGYTFVGWYKAPTMNNTTVTAWGTQWKAASACTNTNGTYTVASEAQTASGLTYYARFDVAKSSVTAVVKSNTGTAQSTYTSTAGGTVSVYSGSEPSPAVTTAQFYYGGSVTIKATAAAAYNFDGWYTDSALTTAASGTGVSRTITKGASNETYYAKFSIKTFAVSAEAKRNTAANETAFTTDGGGTISGTGTKYYGQNVTLEATPAEGYSFNSWYEGNTQLGTNAKLTLNAVTGARTITARFSINKFTLNFDANQGAGGAVTTDTVYYNTAYTIPSGTTPSRVGYIFKGWAETSTASSAAYTTSVSAAKAKEWYNAVGKDGTKTIYAVWEARMYNIQIASAYNSVSESTVYRIGTTGGSASKASGVTNIKTAETIRDKFTISPATGYEIAQWRYMVTSSTEEIPSQGSAVSESWGKTGTNTSQMPDSEDEGIQLYILVYFSVKKYDVTAYAMTNSLANANSYTNSAAGGTVKAGSSGTPGATAVQHGIMYTASTTFIAAPATGYEFGGWYTTNTNGTLGGTRTTSLTISVTVQDDTSNSAINSRYAAFSLATYTAYGRSTFYTVSKDDLSANNIGQIGTDGGTVAMRSGSTTLDNDEATKSMTVVYKAEVEYTATVKNGYEFVGWYISTDTTDNFNAHYGDTKAGTNTTYKFSMPANDVRVIASFAPVTFVLKLNKNTPDNEDAAYDGAVTEIIVTYNKAVTLTREDHFPVYAGHTLIGWSDDPSGSKDYEKEGPIGPETVNDWYDDVKSLEEDKRIKTIFAVWELTKYEVALENLGGTGGQTSVSVNLGAAMPSLEGKLPTYSGYKFSGYYKDTQYNANEKYYNNNGTSAKPWEKDSGGTLYAKWVCPVLKDVTYDNGVWTYSYETGNPEKTATKQSGTPFTSSDEIAQEAPDDALNRTSVDNVIIEHTQKKLNEAQKINLNHFKQDVLEELLTEVKKVETTEKQLRLTQPELNLAVAEIAEHKEETFANNVNSAVEKDGIKPSVKVYDTQKSIREGLNSRIIVSAESTVGKTYSRVDPANGSGNYTYAGKWAHLVPDGVNYYIYTNSTRPVIAVELDDGEVAATAKMNTSSYPTTADLSGSIQTTSPEITAGYSESASKATDDLDKAWFTKYTKAGIGNNSGVDYNAKGVIYLEPDFSGVSGTATNNEVVYTIKPKDDALNPNLGIRSATLAGSEVAANKSLSSYKYKVDVKENEVKPITIAICYHNSMNGTGDMGGAPDDPYLQMYTDQVNRDTWLNQMHLFRTSGGASNWEMPAIGDSIYKIVDQTYPNGELGSFGYIFNPSEIPGFSTSNDETAKNAVISKISQDISGTQVAITDRNDPRHYNAQKGLGFFAISNWSTNFYPKQGTYIYAHLVDRWGNVFNKVWQSFKVDSYASTIRAGLDGTYDIFEDGGSNISNIDLNSTNIEFILDETSTMSDGVFTTTNGSFSIKTGEPNKTYNITIKDNATNETKATVLTRTEYLRST